MTSLPISLGLKWNSNWASKGFCTITLLLVLVAGLDRDTERKFYAMQLCYAGSCYTLGSMFKQENYLFKAFRSAEPIRNVKLCNLCFTGATEHRNEFDSSWHFSDVDRVSKRGDMEPPEAAISAEEREGTVSQEPHREGRPHHREAELPALRHDNAPRHRRLHQEQAHQEGKKGLPVTSCDIQICFGIMWTICNIILTERVLPMSDICKCIRKALLNIPFRFRKCSVRNRSTKLALLTLKDSFHQQVQNPTQRVYKVHMLYKLSAEIWDDETSK